MKMIEGQRRRSRRSGVRHQPRPAAARSPHLHRRRGEPPDPAADLRQLRAGPRRHGAERRPDPGDGHREVPAPLARPSGQARQEAMRLLRSIEAALAQRATCEQLAAATTRNFFGPIQTIIPWASNHYTETLIERVRERVRPSVLGLPDAGRHVGRRHGLHLRARAQGRGPGLPAGADERDQAAAAARAAVCHGAGGLRFRDQRRGTVAALVAGRRGLDAAGLLRDLRRRVAPAATCSS